MENMEISVLFRDSVRRIAQDMRRFRCRGVHPLDLRSRLDSSTVPKLPSSLCIYRALRGFETPHDSGHQASQSGIP